MHTKFIRMHPTRHLIVSLLLALLPQATSGSTGSASVPAAAEAGAVSRLAEPRSIEDFSLLGSDGQAFTKSRLLGRWSLVFVGFMSCPDYCPSTLAVLRQVSMRLKGEPVQPQVVFVSVDPQRDRPEQLAKYVQYFNPDYLAATGRIPELDKLARNLGFTYSRESGSSGSGYTMNHSISLYLLDPQARVSAVFDPPLMADPLTAELQKLLVPGD
jgi:protein SCO1